MTDELHGKNALVTGGSQGIGMAIARRLAEEGCLVTVVDQKPPREQLPGITYVHASVSDPASMERAVSQAAEHGRLDICVANAGVYREHAAFLEADPRDWRDTLEINVTGVLITLQTACRAMLRNAPQGGTMIVLSSVAGLRPEPDCPAYSASKAGASAIVESLSAAWGQFDIRVVGIAPGPVETPAQAEIREQRLRAPKPSTLAEASFDEVRAQRRPIRRNAEPQEIAELALFLVSERAAYITGTTICIDGGGHLV